MLSSLFYLALMLRSLLCRTELSLADFCLGMGLSASLEEGLYRKGVDMTPSVFLTGLFSGEAVMFSFLYATPLRDFTLGGSKRNCRFLNFTGKFSSLV